MSSQYGREGGGERRLQLRHLHLLRRRPRRLRPRKRLQAPPRAPPQPLAPRRAPRARCAWARDAPCLPPTPPRWAVRAEPPPPPPGAQPAAATAPRAPAAAPRAAPRPTRAPRRQRVPPRLPDSEQARAARRTLLSAAAPSPLPPPPHPPFVLIGHAASFTPY